MSVQYLDAIDIKEVKRTGIQEKDEGTRGKLN